MGVHPLDPALRRLFEASFDDDLSNVVIVRGGAADRLCRRLGADGCATGRTVYLASPSADARNERGLWLLAHEVAHVVQQRRGPVPSGVVAGRLAVGLSGGRHEREADRAADAVLAGARHIWDPTLLHPPGDTGEFGVTYARNPVLQLHSSHEHRLIGDVTIDDMAHLAGLDEAGRRRVLLAQRDLMREWTAAPQDLSAEYVESRVPWLKVIRLPNGTVMTYGELNSLADYLPNPDAILRFPRDQMVSLLQTIREESYRRLSELAGVPVEKVPFPGSVYSRIAPSGLLTLRNLNRLIASASSPASDHMTPMLCRNIGHFAPHAWYRWEHYQNVALNFAYEASRAQGQRQEDVTRLAWINAGYAEHFLQDAFAAGHLGNKVLAQQWNLPTQQSRGVLWAKLTHPTAAMTVRRQPHVHGPHLYGPYRPGLLSNDPQTVDELATSVRERVELLGLDPRKHGVQRTYRDYLTGLLGNLGAQLNSMKLHDFLNESGLRVASAAHPTPYLIGGDETLIRGGPGLENMKAASDRARASIRGALDGKDQRGATAEIFSMLPSMVKHGGEVIPLQDWHTVHAERLCRDYLYRLPSALATSRVPNVVQNVMSDSVRVLGQMSDGYKSQAGRRSQSTRHGHNSQPPSVPDIARGSGRGPGRAHGLEHGLER
ncbi:eCIS core domain-containing protein [Yinghuangia sp. YIM S09857]|uniref:eCIS core domain-containing protein n=1 Tax=Yinghuangia sp. YIM S09857 TaxID=3436929 RepID=UPI003F52B7A8